MTTNKRKSPRKHRTVAYRGFKLRQIIPKPGDTHKSPFWMADNCDRKKRVRASFKTLEDAKLFVDQKAVEVENHGRAAYALTPGQRIEAVKAFQSMAGRSSLMDAVQFWQAHHPDGTAVPLGQMLAEWIRELQRGGRRPPTIREARNRGGVFVREVGEGVPCATVTGETVRRFIEGLDCAPATRNGWRRVLGTFFEYCIRRRVVHANPVREVEMVKRDEGMPEFMPVKMVERFMAKAEELHPESVAAFAVMFFAGLRPSEVGGQYGLAGTGSVLGGLQWKDVNLAERVIRVNPETSKNRRTRLVDISDNLLVWLTKHYRANGPVAPPPPTMKRMRQDIMAAVKMKAWIPDICRHSFASYFYAKHQDVGRLQAQMGHTGDAAVLFNHYRGLATRAEADRFWDIAPSDAAQGGQVVQMARKGA